MSDITQNLLDMTPEGRIVYIGERLQSLEMQHINQMKQTGEILSVLNGDTGLFQRTVELESKAKFHTYLINGLWAVVGVLGTALLYFFFNNIEAGKNTIAVILYRLRGL
jgi:hypothetical protein